MNKIENEISVQNTQEKMFFFKETLANLAKKTRKAAGEVFEFYHDYSNILGLVAASYLTYNLIPSQKSFRLPIACLAGVSFVVLSKNIKAQKSSENIAPSIPSSVLSVTRANFQSEVLESKTPVILDAYASWCYPCKIAAPIFKELKNEFDGRVKFVQLNVDQESVLAKKLKIQAMPTFLVFREGKIVETQVGLADNPKEMFRKLLENHL